jgi:hypothetical protein
MNKDVEKLPIFVGIQYLIHYRHNKQTKTHLKSGTYCITCNKLYVGHTGRHTRPTILSLLTWHIYWTTNMHMALRKYVGPNDILIQTVEDGLEYFFLQLNWHKGVLTDERITGDFNPLYEATKTNSWNAHHIAQCRDLKILCFAITGQPAVCAVGTHNYAPDRPSLILLLYSLDLHSNKPFHVFLISIFAPTFQTFY